MKDRMIKVRLGTSSFLDVYLYPHDPSSKFSESKKWLWFNIYSDKWNILCDDSQTVFSSYLQSDDCVHGQNLTTSFVELLEI